MIKNNFENNISMYIVDMFQKVYEYIQQNNTDERLYLLGENEIAVTIEDKEILFTFIYNLTDKTYGLKVESLFLNSNFIYLVPDLIEFIEVYDINDLCNFYRYNKNKKNLCSFINSSDNFFEFLYFVDKGQIEYSYDEFLNLLCKSKCCPLTVAVCHKQYLIYDEIKLKDRISLAYFIHSGIKFNYTVNGIVYITLESVNIVALSNIFKSFNKIDNIDIFLEYKFVNLEHFLKYLSTLRHILDVKKNVSYNLAIRVDTQQRIKDKDLCIFLSSYGQEITNYPVNILLDGITDLPQYFSSNILLYI